MVEQKVALICFRAGSDELVGTNLTFVANKDDHFMEKVYKQVFELQSFLSFHSHSRSLFQ